MKTLNTYFKGFNNLLNFINENEISDNKKLLIQIFTSENDYEFISELKDFFSQNFPKASLIGSTTDGEICKGKVSVNKTVISFTTFENTKLETYIAKSNGDYFEAGKKLAKKLIKKNTKVIISFIDGLSGNGEIFLNGINSVNDNIIVAGGMAGDNSLFDKTFVFTKEKILTHGVVGVTLNSKVLNIFTDYSFDWQHVGQKLKITKAVDNRVYMIDDMTAVEAYTYYLGKEIGKRLPNVGIEFPLIIQNGELNIARAVIGKHDDGSLVFAGNLKDGNIVRFGCADFDSILNETQTHLNKLEGKSIESFFIYSCMVRRRFIPETIEAETLVYNDIAPTCGFYTYGEFYSHGKEKMLLNQSMTVLALSETNNKKTKKVKFKTVKHKRLTLQALSHLINVSTKELVDTQIKLEILSTTDPLTKLYNRRHFTDVSQDIFNLSKRENTPVSVVMLDIDKFKNINDTYGHEVGDKVIVALSETLLQHQRKSDVTCRYGGEEFIILLPLTGIEGAKVLAEKLRKIVETTNIEIDDKILNFTVSIGISEADILKEENIENAIRRADKALYEAKNGGRNQVVSN